MVNTMAFPPLLIVVAILAAVTTASLLLREKELRKRRNGLRALPGPTGLPFIGSLHELSLKNSWMKFHEWGERYGSVYQVNLAGTNHVWICRDDVARDILVHRAAFTSDRPHLAAIAADNRTSSHYLPLMSRNAIWARQRKFTKQVMDQSVDASFYSYPELEALRLMNALLSDKTKYHNALESYTARVASRLAWQSPHAAEELKQRARELLISVSPTSAIVNTLTFLNLLPEKLLPWKLWERRRARTERSFFNTMQQYATEFGVQKQSWARAFVENRKRWKFSDDTEASYAVGMNAIASTLTPSAPMQSFCLALCYYPQYVPVLHEEIDRVCGDRRPTLADMPNMPILRAFLREVQRWRPAVPGGIPHEATEDFEYNGYFIPKGSSIHALEWSIGRDPEMYPEPEAFNPLRWIDPKYPTYREPLSKYPTITGYSQYGYGNRICGGQPLVEASVFVGCASIAWLFTVGLPGLSNSCAPAAGTTTPPPEEEIATALHDQAKTGAPKPPSQPTPDTSKQDKNWFRNDPTMDFSTLIIAKPMPFNVEMKIRSPERAKLAMQEWLQRKIEGEFEDDKTFWTDDKGRASHEGNQEFGWGETYA